MRDLGERSMGSAYSLPSLLAGVDGGANYAQNHSEAKEDSTDRQHDRQGAGSATGAKYATHVEVR